MALILGLESSCDETAAALVTSERVILAHKLAGQEAEHAPFGGVVPEIAARAHVEVLTPLIEAALAEAKVSLADVDAIAATAGPVQKRKVDGVRQRIDVLVRAVVAALVVANHH